MRDNRGRRSENRSSAAMISRTRSSTSSLLASLDYSNRSLISKIEAWGESPDLLKNSWVYGENSSGRVIGQRLRVKVEREGRLNGEKLEEPRRNLKVRRLTLELREFENFRPARPPEIRKSGNSRILALHVLTARGVRKSSLNASS